MASIKDAVEESFSDNHAFIKYFLYAIPVYIPIGCMTVEISDLFS